MARMNADVEEHNTRQHQQAQRAQNAAALQVQRVWRGRDGRRQAVQFRQLMSTMQSYNEDFEKGAPSFTSNTM